MLRIKDLELTYRSAQGQFYAVRRVSLTVEAGKFFTLLGPSGCGKTTTLRCVAGLERPDAGEIVIGDTVVCSSQQRIWIPPHERPIGMVFQSYAIWPHMSVFENVAFPLQQGRPRLPRAAVRERVMQALATVKLEHLVDRPAPNLSGGQQQRLALARSLVREPKVLLLDEPLSNLDAKLREEMRLEIRQLVERFGITTLFVTHEQIEALSMSDVVAVMNEGRIIQQSAPHDIYCEPESAFVASFIGKSNIIGGTIVGPWPATDGRYAQVETSIGMLRCAAPHPVRAGEIAEVSIRPEDIALVEESADAENTVAASLLQATFVGEAMDCIVDAAGTRLRLRLPRTGVPALGKQVRLTLPPAACRLLRQTEPSDATRSTP